MVKRLKFSGEEVKMSLGGREIPLTSVSFEPRGIMGGAETVVTMPRHIHRVELHSEAAGAAMAQGLADGIVVEVQPDVTVKDSDALTLDLGMASDPIPFVRIPNHSRRR